MAWQQLAEVKASMAQVEAELRDMDHRMDRLVMTMQTLLGQRPASAGAVDRQMVEAAHVVVEPAQ